MQLLFPKTHLPSHKDLGKVHMDRHPSLVNIWTKKEPEVVG